MTQHSQLQLRFLSQLSDEQNLQQFFPGFKVIIHKSRGEAFLVEQDKIENVSVAYLKSIIIFKKFFSPSLYAIF